MMSVSLLVCTYGSKLWQERGLRALDRCQDQPTHEAFAHHHHDPGATIASVRNAAAALASGDWLCFLDADDELSPGYMNAMGAAMHHWNLWRPHDLLEHPAVLVPRVAQAIVKDGRAHGLTEPIFPNGGGARPLYEINWAVIGSLIPRSLFEQVGGFQEWKLYEDWALWLAATRAGARLHPVLDAIYVAHSNEEGRNLSSPQDQARVYAEIRAHHLANEGT